MSNKLKVQPYKFLTMENKKTFREVFDFPWVEHNFFQNFQHLTLNKSISWSTKWSTKMKLKKMKNKDSSKYYRTTLQSPNLINLYPNSKTFSYLSNQYPKEIKQDFLPLNANYSKNFLPCKTETWHWMVSHHKSIQILWYTSNNSNCSTFTLSLYID